MSNHTNLQWALQHLAQSQATEVDMLRLNATLSALATDMPPLQQLQQVCAGLGLTPPDTLPEPDRAHLPLVWDAGPLGWGIVIDQDPAGRWVVATERHGVVKRDPIGLQGSIAKVQLRTEIDLVAASSSAGVATRADSFSEQLAQTLRQHRFSLVEAALASAFMGLLALATSMYSMQVYDRVIPTRSEYTLVILSIGVLLSILIELAIKFARSHIMDFVTVGMDNRLSREVFQRLLQLRIDQIPASVGSLAGQLRGYEQVRGFYTASTLFTLVDLPFGLLFLVIIGMVGSTWVAMVPLVSGAIALLLGLSIRKRISRIAAEGAALSNMKTGLLVEAVEGIETIKAGAGGWKFLSRWIGITAQTIHSDLRMRSATESVSYLAATVQQISYAGLVAAGALTVMQGHMTMGALIACSILSGRILSPVMAIPGLLVQHAHAKAAMSGLQRLYDLKSDNQDVARPLVPAAIHGNFALSGVQFSYAGNPPALGVDRLAIQPGERIAVLGPIGAGKSTLLRLLSGLYQPQEGSVLLDSLDMAHISRQLIAQQIGYLQQDHRLFQGTLRENLLIGMPDPGDAVLATTMARTGMDRFVTAHPKGLDRMIAEGGKGLSGGQRQLVAFTRLILCNTRVLLLDEPTATMDDEQERRCLTVLAEEAKAGKTLVIVTHKPSVLPLVSRIIVVAGSSIVMDGPRDAVLQQLAQPGKAA